MTAAGAVASPAMPAGRDACSASAPRASRRIPRPRRPRMRWGAWLPVRLPGSLGGPEVSPVRRAGQPTVRAVPGGLLRHATRSGRKEARMPRRPPWPGIAPSHELTLGRSRGRTGARHASARCPRWWLARRDRAGPGDRVRARRWAPEGRRPCPSSGDPDGRPRPDSSLLVNHGCPLPFLRPASRRTLTPEGIVRRRPVRRPSAAGHICGGHWGIRRCAQWPLRVSPGTGAAAVDSGCPSEGGRAARRYGTTQVTVLKITYAP